SFDSTKEPLQFALKHPVELPFIQGFEQPLGLLLTNDAVTFRLPDGPSVSWTLHLADFPSLLQTPEAAKTEKPHTVFYDAFSLKKNPAMWTLPVFTRLFALLDAHRPCSMATYSRSTILRVTLLLAGFYVGVGHQTGEKE